MEHPARLEFEERCHGRFVIVEYINGRLEFWEKEFGGVRWYRFNGTPDLVRHATNHFYALSSLTDVAA